MGENHHPRSREIRPTRRGLIGVGLLAPPLRKLTAKPNRLPERICLFTDHLGGFAVSEAAEMLAGLGVSGPDLTVRKGGLVAPEYAARDLPRAMEAFRERGMDVPMITTSITTMEQGRSLLPVAASSGLRYYKLGYFYYEDMSRWRQQRQAVANHLRGLADLNRELGIHGGFHTHSGPNVGGLLWDALEILDLIDPKWLGIYFDTAHAVIEGGKNGWNYGLRRAASRITMASVKDFIWEKIDGKWRTRWVPLGEGMVPFNEMLPILAEIPFPGPISLHIEYDPGGSTKAERVERSTAAAKRDLAFLRGKLANVSRG